MTPELVLRDARPSERAQLEALQRRASLALDEYRGQLLAHPDAIALPAEQIAAGQVIVAEARGRLVGFAAWLSHADGAELDGLFVEPDCWGRGIGTSLAAKVAEIAMAKGAECLHVIAAPSAADFYLRCGFVQSGDSSTRFGPARRMTRQLSAP